MSSKGKNEYKVQRANSVVRKTSTKEDKDKREFQRKKNDQANTMEKRGKSPDENFGAGGDFVDKINNFLWDDIIKPFGMKLKEGKMKKGGKNIGKKTTKKKGLNDDDLDFGRMQLQQQFPQYRIVTTTGNPNRRGMFRGVLGDGMKKKKLVKLSAGLRGRPNPPAKHWTTIVKDIQTKNNSTWKQALAEWKKIGKPKIPSEIKVADKKVVEKKKKPIGKNAQFELDILELANKLKVVPAYLHEGDRYKWFNGIMGSLVALNTYLGATSNNETKKIIEQKIKNFKNSLPNSDDWYQMDKYRDIYDGNIRTNILEKKIKKYEEELNEIEYNEGEYSDKYQKQYKKVEDDLKGDWNRLNKLYPNLDENNVQYIDPFFLRHYSKIWALKYITKIKDFEHKQTLLLNKGLKRNSKEFKDLQGQINYQLSLLNNLKKMYGYSYNLGSFNLMHETDKHLFGRGKLTMKKGGFSLDDVKSGLSTAQNALNLAQKYVPMAQDYAKRGVSAINFLDSVGDAFSWPKISN